MIYTHRKLSPQVAPLTRCELGRLLLKSIEKS
jgi:hypothetical protein